MGKKKTEKTLWEEYLIPGLKVEIREKANQARQHAVKESEVYTDSRIGTLLQRIKKLEKDVMQIDTESMHKNTQIGENAGKAHEAIKRIEALEEQVEEDRSSLDYHDARTIPGFQRKIHEIEQALTHKDKEIELSHIKCRLKKLEEKCENCIPHGHLPYDPTDWHRSWAAKHRCRGMKIHLSDSEKEKLNQIKNEQRIMETELKLQEMSKKRKEHNKRMEWKNKYLDAIKESIEEIWEPRSRGEGIEYVTCPLCNLARERSKIDLYSFASRVRGEEVCKYCPIFWETGEPHCDSTPFQDWEDAMGKEYLKAAEQVAKEEVNFLKELYYDLLHDKIKDPFLKG